MKKRIKMKKYAEGGMSDDDEGYDAYTTSVTDNEGEVLYEKPTPRAREAGPNKAASAVKKAASVAKKSESVNDSREMRRVGPVSKAEKEPGAYRDFSKLTSGAVEHVRSPEEKAKNAKNAQILGGMLATAIPVGRVAKAAGEVGKAAKMARAARYEREATKLTPKEQAMADRIRDRQNMFGSGRTAREFAEAGGMKRGGKVKGYSSGGSVKSSASKRADGIAQRGKTRGRVL